MKIITSEEKISAKGNKYKRIKVEGNDNELACFSTFSKYAEVVAGAEIDGTIKEKEYNGKKSYTLEDASQPKSGFGGAGVKAAQERKEVMIEKAQERKSDSIAYFNSVNCAITLVSKHDVFEKMSDQEVENAIVQWREWFLSEYRKYEAKDITEKRNAC
jgi:hypothetical protein